MRNVSAFSGIVEAEVLLERILTGLEEALHERLVHDGHEPGRLVVGLA